MTITRMQNINTPTRPHVLFLVNGMGEFAQAEGMARYLQAQHISFSFLMPDIIKDIGELARKNGFECVIKKTGSICKEVERQSPDVLMLCNAKTTMRLLPRRPRGVKLVGSLDSNWLFSERLAQASWIPPTWVDYFFVVFPKSIYNTGLRANGGHYEISKTYVKKIIPVGFVPSEPIVSDEAKKAWRKKLGITAREKVITMYFGRGGTYRPLYSFFALSVLRDLQRTHAFRIVVLGEPPAIPLAGTRHIKWMKHEDFSAAIAASDLLMQHHGMGTLAKAIRQCVPTICFTHNFRLADKQAEQIPSSLHFQFFEVDPFARANACRHFTIESARATLQNDIEELLYRPAVARAMRAAQAAMWQNGEEHIWKFLDKRL